jgi:peptidoglycan/xylan/chitin deacetylase (PgdA/CDA1 family)
MTDRGVYSSRAGRPLHHASLLLCVVGLAGWILHLISPLWFLLSLALRLLVIVAGSFFAASGVFGRVLLRGPTDRPLLALTFDDGPDPETTPQILDLLAAHHARATFFVIGERVVRHPALMARVVAEGHQVENHSHRHSWATAFGPVSRLVADFSSAQASVVSAGARAPRYFRAPIGILSPPIVEATRKLGLQLVGWSAKARDGWASTTVSSALDRLLPALQPGAILLLHDGGEQLSSRSAYRPTIAPKVLAQLLPQLEARGLQSVTLTELLRE